MTEGLVDLAGCPQAMHEDGQLVGDGDALFNNRDDMDRLLEAAEELQSLK